MPVWIQPVTNSRPGRFITHMVRRYFAHDIGRQGAALAYYLLFTIFPFMIFVSSLLGMLDLDISSITEALSPLLPPGVVDMVETYSTTSPPRPPPPCSGSASFSPSTFPCGPPPA